MIRISITTPDGVTVAIDLADLMAANPVVVPAPQVVDAQPFALVVSDDPPAPVGDDRPWLSGADLEIHQATLKPSTKLADRSHSYHGRPLPRRGDDISYERGNRCGHCRVSPSDCLALPGCDYNDDGSPNWPIINGRGISV